MRVHQVMLQGADHGAAVLIYGGGDKTVVWDQTTGQPVGSPFTCGTNDVTEVATTQLDGRPVVTSGSGDHTVRVGDVAAGAHANPARRAQ